MTDASLVIGVVRAPERSELAEPVGRLVGEFRRAQPVDGIRTGALADLHHLVADLADRPLPGNAVPLAVDQLEGIAQAPVGVGQFPHRRALGAMRAAIEWTVPARLLTDPDVIGDLGNDGAADRTM